MLEPALLLGQTAGSMITGKWVGTLDIVHADGSVEPDDAYFSLTQDGQAISGLTWKKKEPLLDKQGKCDARSLSGGTAVIADHARHFPLAVIKLPQRDELRLADTYFLGAGVNKAMSSHLHCAVVIQTVDLKRARNEHALRLTADVVANAVDESLRRCRVV
jgi:hypothetical protein